MWRDGLAGEVQEHLFCPLIGRFPALTSHCVHWEARSLPSQTGHLLTVVWPFGAMCWSNCGKKDVGSQCFTFCDVNSQSPSVQAANNVGRCLGQVSHVSLLYSQTNSS